MQVLFAVGLLLTLATSALLVRANWVSDRLHAAWGNRGNAEYAEHVVQVRTSPGLVSIIWTRFAVATVHARVIERVTVRRGTGPPNPPNIDFGRTGRFHYWVVEHPVERGWVVERKAILPMWPAPLACAVLTAAILFVRACHAHRRRTRLQRGVCATCGYDLRGVAHERCPECGQAVAAGSHVEPSPLSKMK